VNLSQLAGYSEENKTEELIRLLDEYFMLLLGKTWGQIVTDFESRPVLVVLRDIYEAAKPWIHFSDEDTKISYRENYDCLIEKITQKFSRQYTTINKVREFLEINITTYQEAASRNAADGGEDIKVICTTIHKSKGLEYGTVIVLFNDEDISNIDMGGLTVNIVNGKVSYSLSLKGQGSDYSGDFDDKTEVSEKICEETRVLYVAMTRAIRNYVWFKDLDSISENSWRSYMEENE
jgi:ATP-dependent exoDNAse (exonuclease V) beta subunit